MEDNPFRLGNGWEPYTLSLRIVNLVKWQLETNTFVPGLWDSICQQSHVLSRTVEYHLRGNHLFANAKALVFAGLFLQGPLPNAWYQKGMAIIKEQLVEQFLSDGAHFELSTTYHATLTEDLLDIINILKTYEQEVPRLLVETAKRAMAWLKIMTRPDGLPPLFNDAAYGLCPTFEKLKNYTLRLGVKWEQKQEVAFTDLPASGYFRYDGENYSFWGDAGQIGPDYIPGHAHCDMFNFEMFAYGQPVVVDTGTSTYEVGTRRTVERSTAAHNTVQLGEHEQSEVWGTFRVGRRARILERKVTKNNVTASHNGFSSNGIIHHRSFQFDSKRLHLEDVLEGRPKCLAVARFHLHPDIKPAVSDGKVQAGGVTFVFSGEGRVEITLYEYAPEFNTRIEAHCIDVYFDQHLSTDIFL